MKKRLTLLCIALLPLTGCMTASQHNEQLGSLDEERLTVAAVQREIRQGMSGAEVLVTLGSPNIVSTDADRHEVWVYDRVGTEYVYSNSGTGLISLIGGSANSVVGGLMPRHEQNAGASRRSQRTLTIIIKFDENRLVKDYSYHSSRF
jgi:outer membrane protein assembly factor BamE (lipoprotein component of BamABCDE complex)